MQKKRNNSSVLAKLVFTIFGALFILSFLKVHVGVQTTLVGYRLGQLKASEAEILERRSQLQMQLAKLSTREHLSLLANSIEQTSELGTLAAVNLH